MDALLSFVDFGNSFCNNFAQAIYQAVIDGRMTEFDKYVTESGEVHGFSRDTGQERLDVGLQNGLAGRELAEIAIHEGFHQWLMNGQNTAQEEQDAAFWQKECVPSDPGS